MKNLLCIPLLLMLSGLALGQTNVPPCDPNTAANCTDYFGVANWANSPLPAGSITGFTIVASGSGYVTPNVVITDPTGLGATAPTVTLGATGAIATITGGGGGSGYIAPQVTIVDLGLGGTVAAPTCGGATQPACGSGALATAVLGGVFSGGIHKFLDALPSLAIAVPDTTTFPGSDYYVIALKQYTSQMHADLPATTLRGYVQLNNGTDTSGNNTVAPPPISYLGPTIIAQKNRPVRVLFKNMLPTGAGGNLFLPTDTTYMGAGAPYTQNRATLHLHGGATPWISDGTPHQWTVPAGETGGPDRGASTQLVPDMYFVNGVVVPQCSATVTTNCSGGTAAQLPATATNDPGQGSLTFFWTNQQGGRLMFYHDHAYGITRLNVYAGEAAGYLLYDPAEETALAAATVPGTITSAGVDLAHLVPLVIQDKTFVPSQPQLMVEDPTWAGNFGATALSAAASNGDLWFPHIYMTNQNPADAGAANGFGRWDYGPWFFPPQTTLTASPTVTIPCTSAAFPNQVVQCPITPNPSGTPEAFMDTPVVNGKAYPVLHVAPAAYRFKILSVGNDRSLNLQLYVADPTVTTPDGRKNTEVKMLPATPPAAGAVVPLCSAVNPVAVPALVLGLATALTDSSGKPLNGTGLPANCWPNYGAPAGIPVQQTMWAADGRAGGVPDPRTAGPPFIQIGTEGGLLPAPVVIPSTPVGYEANTRSITITSVSVHGLWLGPAERADAIVDFSSAPAMCAALGVSPCTLILYNDAPTPAPAIDSRTDYFTGDGDQTPIGGAPNTQPGYGPNTRTIMQIVVDQTGSNTTPFNLAALQSALPGLFSQTQPPIIVPEPTYPAASGGHSASAAYSGISDNSLTYNPLGGSPQTVPDEQKAIQELFTLDYGRMNATLGTELPFTNFNTQTTIPLGYVDPPTEVINQGDTQLWKITHNGVDSHFIHFHLFNVQVINRVGWDGSLRPPDSNELGWKDTVRMNPLEDILVALQPIKPVPPFPVRDSYRLLDVMAGLGTTAQFTNINPFTNNPQTTPNVVNNFGWEYVWHCHILGHEESDMMRPMTFQVPPEAPSNLVVAAAVLPQTGLNLTWTDKSASETGFTLQRAADAGFTTNVVSAAVPPIAGSTDSNGQGITWGGTLTYNDASATGPGPYFYRVEAFKPDASYWTPSGTNITSAWSNTASLGAIAAVSPAALVFGTVALNTPSAPQTVTLSNTGAGPLTYILGISGANPNDFKVTANPCAGNAAAASTCAISVTFTPSVSGPESAILSLTTSDPAHPTLTVSLTGTGGTLPLLTITASNATMKYGSAVPVITASYNPPNPVGLTTQPACTTTATNRIPVGSYPATCAGAVGPYTFTYVAGTVSVTPVPLTIFAPNATMNYGGTVPTLNPLPATNYVGFVAGDTPANLTTQPACTTTATSTNTTPPGKYPSTCSGAVDRNYTISYVNGTVTVARGALTVATNSATRVYGAANPPITTISTGLAGGDTLASLGITCSTTAVASSPVSPPTYPITCTGPASTANYATITYTNPGALTITAVPLRITAGSLTVAYGAPKPAIAPSYSGFVLGQGPGNLTGLPTCSTTYTQGSPVGSYPSSCSGATSTNYTFNYVNGTVTVNRATTTTSITSHLPSPSTLKQPVVVAFAVAPQFTGTTPTGNVTVTASTGESCTGTVAAGNCSITTFNTAGTRTLTATYAGSSNFLGSTSAGVSQRVNAPTVSLSPNNMNFGNVTVNTTSPPSTATLTNTGAGALINLAWSITGTNASNFSIASTTCTATLAPGASCRFNITFRPSATGSRTASLTLTDNALNSPQSNGLSGRGR